ncbi:ATP-binding cassette domain-containing protein [Antribacter gilvus]|uniref:ATP-binding cassette domain-containing protein n=1 Tax=Antribacter gilvus TaxID=2304675 RepID=UPI000F7A664C|nr:ATP-binding cassette domain-containing protein [Antribacter gilvus]
MSSITGIDVTKAFGDRTLFDGLSFKVAPGQMVALTGPSGSGKSTLLNCVGLLEDVTSGAIEVDGRDITTFGGGTARRFRRDTLGYLFQNYALVENATVRFNLDIALAPGRKGAPGIPAEEALERVGLGGRGKEPVFRMSGGEQQRVALARLLVKAPPVVLADEPTGALDEANADMVLSSLRSIADDGAAVLIATHSQHVVDACTDVLRVGKA